MSLIEQPKAQFAQIADLLRDRIEKGTYAPGSLMPSEPELATELGVSRVTVNRAIALLRAAGHVKVRRGSGTVVRRLPMIRRDAQRRYANREQGTGAGEVEIRSMNLRSRTAYREIGRTKPPEEVAAALELKPREDALVRRRILYADDEPTQTADTFFPWAMVKSSSLVNEHTGLDGGSYAVLASLGIGPVRFTEDITVRLATDEEQRLLDVEPTQPVFRIWHVAYAQGDRPVGVTIHVMPGHLWSLHYGWDDLPKKAGH